MISVKNLCKAILLLLPLALSISATPPGADDDVPEITARVARISFLQGSAQLKRSDGTAWESAKLNLPIVEGDEISVGPDSLVELQLDTRTHVRLNERSFLRVVTLQDGRLAFSLPEGSMIVRLSEFDPQTQFVEMDAPQTTVAVQKAGIYRIDAGREEASGVRITVMEHGEARVYSSNAGFNVRSGRSAFLTLSGSMSGEWDTADASKFADDFDTWSLNRDSEIAKLLQDAHYDQYYDRDIYGAEDLSQHGEWIHTRKYGYVWKPFSSSLNSYSNWSPYRYGEWRWLSPYGWTWVNDEPWGWATYHHGRWVYDMGAWYWTPYGANRYARSWWYPALVYMNVYNSNIYWYPLPYSYSYYDYNYYCGGWGRPRPHRPYRPQPNPAQPTPIPGGVRPGTMDPDALDSNPPPGSVTTTQVTALNMAKQYRPASEAITKAAVIRSESPSEPVKVLPTSADSRRMMASDSRVSKPSVSLPGDATMKTGAVTRMPGKAADPELRRSRIYGDRPPVSVPTAGEPVRTASPETRKTGAVERPVLTPTQPVRVPRSDTTRSEPVRVPVYTPPATTSRPSEPVRVPRNDTPRSEPVRAPRNDTPRSEPVRAPRNDTPRSEPARAPRNDPPPQKSDSAKPSPSAERKGKD